MATTRNRASGWQHAKLSGHKNESAVQQLFNDEEYKASFSKRLGIGEIASVSVGGLSETDVKSVFGGKTKSKTDLTITLKDGQFINISIKKSAGGQVYLIGVERFIDGFEKHFNKTIPDEVKNLLSIYFYGSPMTNDLLNDNKITGTEPPALVAYQRKHNRLVWDTLANWGAEKKNTLLDWFKENIADITDYCFARGLASDKKDWAQYVWYINCLGEDDFDEIFSIEEIKNAVSKHAEDICPGLRKGGSTTQLPFGFVQWHLKQMQFHHSLSKLLTLVSRRI